MAQRAILTDEVVSGVMTGELVEDYPDFHVGPAVLVLQKVGIGGPLHVVWGVDKDLLGAGGARHRLSAGPGRAD